jgi:hypothetical protein
MHGNGVLELAAATNDMEAAKALASERGGIAYCDERENWQSLPFRALATVVTDDIDAVNRVGDVGVYVIFRRLIKPGLPNAVALFPMVMTPDKSHVEADAHWRDVHGPLALEHHKYMTHYSQLSVVANLSGLSLDGFAACGFESVDDLRNRFYSGPESPAVISADVKHFADLERSTARLIAVEYRYGT